MKIYEYFYYILYKLVQKTSHNDIAEYTTSFLLSIMIGSNIIMILKLMSVFSAGVDVRTSKIIGAIIGVPIIILNLIYFIRKERYKKIVERYAGKSERDLLPGKVIALSIIAESLFLPFFI